MKKRVIEEDDLLEGEDIYSEEKRDLLLENDELSPVEDAFMRGYEESFE